MKISLKQSLALLVVIAATTFITLQLAGPNATAAQDDEMAQMMALGTPGPAHEFLAQWEGNWKLTTKWRMAPDTPWTESSMKATSHRIMGGRYLIEKVSGPEPFPGAGPFEGMSIMGYDNFHKHYFSLWMDTMSTGSFTETGQIDQTGKVLTTTGENVDTMVGKVQKTKSISRVIDANTRKIEMYAPNEKGEMWQSMEILYERQ